MSVTEPKATPAARKTDAKGSSPALKPGKSHHGQKRPIVPKWVWSSKDKEIGGSEPGWLGDCWACGSDLEVYPVTTHVDQVN